MGSIMVPELSMKHDNLALCYAKRMWKNWKKL